MHKSGTTLLARTLHESGIDMGSFDASFEYDQGNHCERAETKRLNKELLGCGDAHSLTVLQVLSPRDASPALTSEMAETVRKLDTQHEHWGFKDPRTCLTFAVWATVLPTCRVVGIYRHPLEVWHHYVHSRSINPLKRLRRAASGWAALTAWYVYNRQLLVCSRDQGGKAQTAACLLLEYGKFMQQDDPLAKLGSFLGAPMRDVRRPDLHRAQQRQTLTYRIARFLQATLFSRDVEQLYRDLEDSAVSASTSKDTGNASSQR